MPGRAAPWKQLGLEIVPRTDRGAHVYQLVYKGRPVANTKITVETDLDEATPNLRSDKDGMFTFTPGKSGWYGLVARHTAAEKVEYNGKRFTHRWYWTNLVVQGAPARAKKAP